MSWKLFDAVLLVSMVVLWAAAVETGWISSTRFIGHVSMLALVLAALASLRADSPTKEQKEEGN